MSEMRDGIERYLASLRRENASPHTLRNYESDLRQFAEHFSVPATVTALDLRKWLSSLYDQELSVVSIRRKLPVGPPNSGSPAVRQRSAKVLSSGPLLRLMRAVL